jgi:sec-independent protein translocase protein TatC
MKKKTVEFMAAKRSPTQEPAPDTDLESGRMPFMSHLYELRDRMRNSAIAFTIGVIVSWFFAKDIYAWLRQPLFESWRRYPQLGDPYLAAGSVTEPFWVYMSVALWSGIFVSSPFIFYQLWKFIAPGLYKNERRFGVSFALVAAIFFVGGAVFCYYFVLPSLFNFLMGYVDKNLKANFSMTEYMDQTRNTMMAFGAVFELPLFIYVLALLGMVTHRSLWKFNRWFIVIAFVVGAILTPSPDVVSQIFMAAPMIVLYNLSILAAYRVTKRREAAAAKLAAE